MYVIDPQQQVHPQGRGGIVFDVLLLVMERGEMYSHEVMRLLEIEGGSTAHQQLKKAVLYLRDRYALKIDGNRKGRRFSLSSHAHAIRVLAGPLGNNTRRLVPMPPALQDEVDAWRVAHRQAIIQGDRAEDVPAAPLAGEPTWDVAVEPEHAGTTAKGINHQGVDLATYGHRPPVVRAGALDAARLIAGRRYGRDAEVALGVCEARVMESRA